MPTKCLGRENLELFLSSLHKVFGAPATTDYVWNRKKTHYRRLWHHGRTVWDLIHHTEEKSRA